jgi:hypothetical protein
LLIQIATGRQDLPPTAWAKAILDRDFFFPILMNRRNFLISGRFNSEAIAIAPRF